MVIKVCKLKLFIFPLVILWVIPTVNVFAIEKQTIGWIEKIKIKEGALQLIAKIDTGATTSSINAKILKEYSKKNSNWIQFLIVNKEGNRLILDREIVRVAKIKRKRALPLERPVVILGVCVGNVYKEEEVNLSKRKNFNYQVLIGRNFLAGDFLVDSEHTYTKQPVCSH